MSNFIDGSCTTGQREGKLYYEEGFKVLDW
jgi:hypothetical protein